MLIVNIANQKGGVGKTTTAISLASGLAMKGKKTLLVDMDPQANATSGLGINLKELNKTIYNVLVGVSDINSCIITTDIENLSLLPSTQDLVGAEIELVPMEHREKKLLYTLKNLSGLDYVIIDCPPSLGLLTLNAMVACRYIIVPLQCEYYALEGLAHLIKTIKIVKKELNPQLDIMGILLTMYDARNNLSKIVYEDVITHFGKKVFKTVIPRNVRLSETPSYGMPIYRFDNTSKGALSYQGFVEEFITRSGYNE
ncbi:MAG: AAA family ATPase [Proteobacteria bacterium]|nr:AAA family ATPase [Pseudomonadota bacterium]